MSKRAEALGASKALNKSRMQLSKQCEVPAAKGGSPRENFDETVDLVVEKLEAFEAQAEYSKARRRKTALDWYRLGLRRGVERATQAVVNGEFTLENGHLLSPATFTIKKRVKLPGSEEAETKEFTFTADELGFK